ncbi:uncharacterized protein PG986_007608 [Apiospora aurea]|uniref:Major facilitator superfamily (MFS) profile domain-containing protein n=1 Tax=Apiospora aurea TaxID=335848 RepID=A0ABR1QD30_9PEZI
MGLGILESKAMEHVPGTTRYYDDPQRPRTTNTAPETRGLKCDKNGIILHPQPSDDPNDPLNWPLWQRDLITFVLSMTAIFATALGPILAANTLTLSVWFNMNFTYVALLTGYYLLGVGFAAIFFVPSGRIWGKRHLFIVGTIILIFSSAWGGASGKNYTSLLWARIIQGVGTAPFESLVNAAVGDLYFVHQRGVRMAFTNLAVFGGAFFTPVVVGKITHTIGWSWTFYLVAIFTAISLFGVIFLCPETSFRRDTRLNTDMAADSGRESTSQDEPEKDVGPYSQTTAIEAGSAGLTASSRPKKTYTESLALFDDRKTDESFSKLLFRPFPCTMIGWTVFIGVILAAVFLGPPRWWSEVETGYAYVGPFRNGGVYEPEFRIFLVIPQFIFGCMGLYGFALTSQGPYHYVVPIMFFAFEVCGMVIGAVASSLYIVDAYRDLAIEGFTCLIIFKNFFSFGLTFKAYDWLVEGGTEPVFYALASVQVVICLTSIPMYIYGKRNRAFFYRHDMLAMTGLR